MKLCTVAVIFAFLLTAETTLSHEQEGRGVRGDRRLPGKGGKGGKGGKKSGKKDTEKLLVKHYLANLNSGQETTECSSGAFGNAYMVVTDHVLCYSVSFTSLVGSFTLAHLHGPALPLEDAGLVIDFMPDLAASYFSNCTEVDDDLEADLDNGLTYINIHSDLCPSGELRGQVLPTFKIDAMVTSEDAY
mmetsp:Transcript_18110/g.26882  ORF Transcript_18110/g.26882 Transcript_18110/m.26882 type:complete len:189 (-) Transcript_18110:400-966(-)|eukprot:CAMPEP_0194056220 /NCGR_PEP_ID=MMETSP0009_2-20130614/59371_1 /TAXON_ID=210454 /ORGANISM="Grammatophora oceanica, Strain CCMP 410" /LENGTH=188 /DNA_ID=CAMNT_0038705489 /DNA_START=77 /DNA_END=643 /DNA_ORIENTATION=-